jgi:hypothetical protein
MYDTYPGATPSGAFLDIDLSLVESSVSTGPDTRG